MKAITIINETFEPSTHVFRGYGLRANYSRVEFRAESETGKTLKKWVMPNDDSTTWKELKSEFYDFVSEVKNRFSNCSCSIGLNEMNF